VTGFLNLVLVANPGAAFSLLSSDGPGQGLRMTALALAALLPLLWFYRQAAASDRGLLSGLGLVLGGAAGNVHDRLRYGAVVDFIDLHLNGAHWPAFNVADAAVCLGAGLLALSVLLGGRQPAAGRGR
jgi:signal peptidase II